MELTSDIAPLLTGFSATPWLQAGVQRALCSPSVEAKRHHVQLEVEGGWEGLEGTVLQ